LAIEGGKAPPSIRQRARRMHLPPLPLAGEGWGEGSVQRHFSPHIAFFREFVLPFVHCSMRHRSNERKYTYPKVN
jgi:hypothetical protein